jgi:uncharacterized protein (TIGR00251 family)
MSDWSGCYDVVGDGVVLRVHVQPRAGRTAVVGRHGDALKLRVSAPPVDDKANEAIVALLAATAGVATSAVAVVGGGRSRAKRVRLVGVAPEALEAAIDAAIGPPGPRAGRVRGRGPSGH